MKYTLNGKWTKNSLLGPEVETSEVLAAFVRHQKPERVIETGCADGDTSFAIGTALKQNGFGTLYTCDIDEERVKTTTERCKDLPVRVFCQTGESLIASDPTHQWDIAFIDSGWTSVRVGEARLVKHYMKPGGFVMCHDCCQNYQGVYYAMEETNWPKIVLHSPYGVAVFQVPGKEDCIGTGIPVQLEPPPPEGA